jgi:hypothetical protein
MTALAWDQVGERKYQTGVDRGVLYLHDGTAVPWNGLIGVEESSNPELKQFYLDGVKFLQNLSPGDYLGKLKAFTYPDEFDAVNGIVNPAPGLSFYEQPPKSFNLSYRTLLGNDLKGVALGYKIHILYNLFAVPDAMGFETLQDSDVSPVEFSWNLTGTPPPLEGFRPTVHISMDSTKTPPAIWEMLEDILYGTETSPPVLPPIEDIGEIFGYLGSLIIIDHGDGSWSAVDESDDYVTMIDPTTFQIDNADATMLDAVTYHISTTKPAAEVIEEVK